MTSVNSNELGLLQARRQCSTRVKYVDNHGGVMAHSLVAKSPTPEAETQSLCRTTPMKTMRSDGSDGSTTVIVFASSCASVFLPLGVGIVISNNVQKKPAPISSTSSVELTTYVDNHRHHHHHHHHQLPA